MMFKLFQILIVILSGVQVIHATDIKDSHLDESIYEIIKSLHEDDELEFIDKIAVLQTKLSKNDHRFRLGFYRFKKNGKQKENEKKLFIYYKVNSNGKIDLGHLSQLIHENRIFEAAQILINLEHFEPFDQLKSNPVLAAIKNNRPGILSLMLLRFGHDILVKTKTPAGLTPLVYSTQYYDKRVINILLNASVNIEEVCSDKTVFDFILCKQGLTGKKKEINLDIFMEIYKRMIESTSNHQDGSTEKAEKCKTIPPLLQVCQRGGDYFLLPISIRYPERLRQVWKDQFGKKHSPLDEIIHFGHSQLIPIFLFNLKNLYLDDLDSCFDREMSKYILKKIPKNRQDIFKNAVIPTRADSLPLLLYPFLSDIELEKEVKFGILKMVLNKINALSKKYKKISDQDARSEFSPLVDIIEKAIDLKDYHDVLFFCKMKFHSAYGKLLNNCRADDIKKLICGQNYKIELQMRKKSRLVEYSFPKIELKKLEMRGLRKLGEKILSNGKRNFNELSDASDMITNIRRSSSTGSSRHRRSSSTSSNSRKYSSDSSLSISKRSRSSSSSRRHSRARSRSRSQSSGYSKSKKESSDALGDKLELVSKEEKETTNDQTKVKEDLKNTNFVSNNKTQAVQSKEEKNKREIGRRELLRQNSVSEKIKFFDNIISDKNRSKSM